jgi:hypothetical protein
MMFVGFRCQLSVVVKSTCIMHVALWEANRSLSASLDIQKIENREKVESISRKSEMGDPPPASKH